MDWAPRKGSDHDILATTAKSVTRTKSVRSVGTTLHLIAEDVLALQIGPWDATGYTIYTYSK